MKLSCPQQHVLWQVARLPYDHRRIAAHFFHSPPPRLNAPHCAASPPPGQDVAAAVAQPDLDSPIQQDQVVYLFNELHSTVQNEQPSVGAFQQLPMVASSEEILGSALKKAKHVQATKGISNIAKRERNRGAKQLDFLMKELAGPLGTYFKKFPRGFELHAYEKALLELTLGKGKYEEVLSNVDFLRKKIVDSGKNMASLCAKSSTKKEANERRDEGFLKLEELFNKHAQHVEDLKETAKILRRLPVVNPRTPILCLVGAPNVGKSSLVRVLSTGKPEVCDYPFTTRGISMGHIKDSLASYQVTDTPGLLRRRDEDRNNMEKLTLAALAYLPTAVLYVHDLTGDCGTSVENQFHIYNEIKGRFPTRPWIDAVSKADLLPLPPPFQGEVDEELYYKAFGPVGALWVSVETNQSVEELRSRVLATLRTISASTDEAKKEENLAEAVTG